MSPLKLKVPAVPKNLGAAIDLLYTLRATRKRAETLAEQQKTIETRFETEIFAKFAKAELSGARGRLAQAAIERREYVTIENFDALATYILKTKALDLLQRRASPEAVKARWANGKTVPGVGKFTKIRLALSAVKKRA